MLHIKSLNDLQYILFMIEVRCIYMEGLQSLT